MFKKNLLVSLCCGALLLGTTTILAATEQDNNMLPCHKTNLSKVVLHLSAEEWAVTNSANVTVEIDATLNNLGLGQMREEVMGKLKKIADTDWHITQFDRTQTESGLEAVQIAAEARLPENAMTNIRTQAKDLSKPGLNFKIANIDFTPSLAELEKTRMGLRAKIYDQVQNELTNLNKVYAEQKYFVYQINFDFVSPMPAMANVMMARVDGARNKAVGDASLSVSNKVIMNASVELASKIKSND
jgi:hypothetical protein